MIEIEKGIPIPTGRKKKYPLDAMKVGESIFIKGGNINNVGSTVYMHAHGFGGKLKCAEAEKDGKKGVRVWRTK